MFTNFFKTAFRNLLRSKVYAVINIAGLSIGLACAMLIMLYINDEVSYDRFHKNISRIYRIDKEQTKDNGIVHTGSYTGYFPGPRFAAAIPEINSFVRFQPAQADIKTVTGVQTQAVQLVDANFFSVFDFPLLSGGAASVLTQPNQVVITEDMAKKYFGTAEAVGKIISIKTDSVFRPFVVSGVAKNCPQNSSIKFDFLLPLKVSAADENNNSNWFNSFLSTFVVLSPGADSKVVQQKMAKVFESDASEAINAIKNKYGVKNVGVTYRLESLASIHLGKVVPDGDEILADKSNPEFSYILSAIALFILLIACINFVNLSVARSVKRAREIGVRKVIGGTRKQLLLQFLSESVLLCFIAFSVALLIAGLVLPLFNQLSGKSLSMSYLWSIKLVTWYLVLFVVTSLLAGFYPAAVLSGYNPVQTLYNRFTVAGKNYLQKSLVIFQFALASFLIIGSLTIFLQFQYLTTQRLGYDDSNLITVRKNQMTRSEAALFKEALLKNPAVIAVAASSAGDNGNTVKVNGDTHVNVAVENIDAAYLPLLQIPVIEGGNFSTDNTGASNVLVNEAFVREAGWKQPVGQQVMGFNGEAYTVRGIVKDYHYKPMTEKIAPQFFTSDPANSYGMMYIKIRPGTETASLQAIAKTFTGLFPLSPFVYNFRKEQNQQAYVAEGRWKTIILSSAILTIFISCIGLFGLSVLSAEKRTKEIGIRKVLGAPVSSIVASLSADFIKLVIVALVLAIPLAWTATNKWLQGYPYRITLSWWQFALAGIIVITIAIIITAFQSVKAAMANPVKSLRTE